MKKLGPAIAVVAVLLFGIGGFLIFTSNKSKTPPNLEIKKTEPKSVFSSIKDALSKSLTLECSFTDETGRSTKSYIKNGAVRADVVGKTAEESSSVIIKDKKMYVWTQNKEGFVMTIPENQDTATSSNQNNQNQEVMDNLEKYKDSCKTGVVSDSLFTPPTDVKFTDMSGLIQKAMPTGGSAPTGIDPAQYEKMMQQYAPDSSSSNEQ